MRRRELGIPEKIVNEQIEDVARISKIWKRKKESKDEEPGLFIVAIDPLCPESAFTISVSLR